MHQGQLVFSQLMLYLPLSTFRRCVASHRGDHKVKDFSCLDQFLAMVFAQLTFRESLRDIGVNLRAQAERLYPMGFRCQTVSRNTLALIAPAGLDVLTGDRSVQCAGAYCTLRRWTYYEVMQSVMEKQGMVAAH